MRRLSRSSIIFSIRTDFYLPRAATFLLVFVLWAPAVAQNQGPSTTVPPSPTSQISPPANRESAPEADAQIPDASRPPPDPDAGVFVVRTNVH